MDFPALYRLETRMRSTLESRPISLAAREDGQTMGEYGITLTVITVAVIAVFSALGADIGGVVNAVLAATPR